MKKKPPSGGFFFPSVLSVSFPSSVSARGIIDSFADLQPNHSVMTEPISASPATTFDWRWKPFSALDAREVYDLLGARSEVFVVEQNCLYADVDGLDLDAWHLLVYANDATDATNSAHNELAAYLRVLLPNAQACTEGDVRIGRVLTTARYRGIKLGNAMLETALAHIARQWPGVPVRLHAQAHLQRFYGAFGFTPISDVHDEDGIAHVWMRAVQSLSARRIDQPPHVLGDHARRIVACRK